MKSKIPILLIMLAFVGHARADVETAKRLASEGSLPSAAAEFSSAAERFLADGDRAMAATSLMNAAACLKMGGDISAATLLIGRAEKVRPPDFPRRLEMRLLAQKGSVLALGKVPGKALPFLRRAFRMAQDEGELLLRADVENDLGITHAALQEHQNACNWFRAAEQHARNAGDAGLAIRARQNHLVASFQLWNEAGKRQQYSVETGTWIESIEQDLTTARNGFLRSLDTSRAMIRQSPPTRLGVFHILTAGLAAQRFGLDDQAFHLLSHGLKASQQTGDLQLERAALLAFAEAYLARSQTADAREVLQYARQLSGQPDAGQTARLEILTAELHRQSGAPGERTIAALQRAIQAIEGIRSDLARTQEISDLGRPFRERAGRPYLLLADEYLREAERHPDRRTALYRQAREVIESFKGWELQDFYRDDCVNLALQNTIELDELRHPDVGILYVIPLDDRVELLLTHAGKIHRKASPLAASDLASLARRFRYDLESDYGSPAAYFEESETLFDALIRPLLPELRRHKIRHLVFVPDGPLGTIPLAALFDRESERYLLEDYSLSVAPSLSLIAGAQEESSLTFGLFAGMSEAVPGFPALPNVKNELKELASLYPQHLLRLNDQFSADRLAADLRTAPAGVVHIACHGEFKGRAADTYLAAAGGERIHLGDLEDAIRPRKFRGDPVELLCLSACRTAAGDDRAALGLAGSAVKSGSRSVVASLWYVQSQATSRLMIDFHRNLRRPAISKAEALRQAQLAFLREDPLAHPRLWAPFILIGNWK